MTDGTSVDRIRELLVGYSLALDAGEIEQCAKLFAPDGEFLVYGRTFAGHQAIAQMFRDAPHGLHLTGASRIDVDGDTGTARSEVLFVRAHDLKLRPALYDDELACIDGQWRFRRRRCRFITSHGLADSPEELPA
jgi:hypothetical protein